MELKPCPFCGGAIEIHYVTGSDQSGECYGYAEVACSNRECRVNVFMHLDLDHSDDDLAPLNARPIEDALASGLAALRARVAELEDEIAHGWRPAVALLYADTGLYTDDGELSDSRAHPFIDFKRDSYDEIRANIQQRGLNWLNEHREEAEAIMSAPQKIAALEAKCERMAKCIEAASGMLHYVGHMPGCDALLLIGPCSCRLEAATGAFHDYRAAVEEGSR